MLIDFFQLLRRQQIPVSIKELLDLLAALENHLAFASWDEFYFLSRTCLIKDEKYFDRYDQVFSAYFQGLNSLDGLIEALIPEDWLRSEFIKQLSEEEKAKIESLGGLEQLIDTFKKRLEEQNSRHQGGNKWVGTGGTSPFGHGGYNPEGIRIGGEGRHRRAVKVWEQRQYKNLDGNVQLGTRNIKVALKRLRQFARTGAQDQLDLDDTIRSTANNAGMLDLKMVAERHNAVKVLLFFDVGGSMDPYIKICEELFSAARSEFKHMKYFYFHNFVYEAVWQDNHRRMNNQTALMDLLHTYGSDFKVIFIGDASMSPYEISHVGGSVEHWNEEAGSVWMRRLRETYQKIVWLNPVPEDEWSYTHSISMTKQLIGNKMYPLTLSGLEEAMSYLSK
jgi:uncharacterized protein with von Willebrand factor type A (vWA) domain